MGEGQAVKVATKFCVQLRERAVRCGLGAKLRFILKVNVGPFRADLCRGQVVMFGISDTFLVVFVRDPNSLTAVSEMVELDRITSSVLVVVVEDEFNVVVPRQREIGSGVSHGEVYHAKFEGQHTCPETTLAKIDNNVPVLSPFLMRKWLSGMVLSGSIPLVGKVTVASTPFKSAAQNEKQGHLLSDPPNSASQCLRYSELRGSSTVLFLQGV